MATRKATENVSEESTTAPETATETEPTASIEQRMAEIETLLNHLLAIVSDIGYRLNSREHIAHCGSDHFVNDWR